ncbi:hypothetical protein BDN71DRAFT_1510662 [Pleurotus eryngii]|uniref:GATA-type domain-containing protein n=1 Tax=Pleurotus eryngii TaxID=5323 RepID=A0A9P5ZRN1_PLEER|nr:hypothetical protein BDN71DRAFT_1510662 [Pleurotus eryngii]
MPNILNLKFKGNKSFVAFSNLNDTESLTKTWKVCTKVASFLEQGQRLENLSWRLWHLQNLMVDTDNAKSKREFRKLSKCMGDKLDKEKGRSIEELEAPDFRRNHSTDMIRQRAEEKERNREASQHIPGTIKRMQFTFSVDQPTPAVSQTVKKPDLKPSPEFSKRPRNTARVSEHTVEGDHDSHDHHNKDISLTQRGRKTQGGDLYTSNEVLKFPTLFSSDFGPSALLYPTPTTTNSLNYGEGLNSSAANDGFSIVRPTIELPLDELLADSADSPDWAAFVAANAINVSAHSASLFPIPPQEQQDVIMRPPVSIVPSSTQSSSPSSHASDDENSNDSDDEASADEIVTTTMRKKGRLALKVAHPQTVAPSKVTPMDRSNTPVGRPALTVRTQVGHNTRSSGPGATATSLNPAVLRSGGNNSAPGGVKAECSNCGATHTPLWRRGLNDELNCNACGLYCKLHKRPRPKNMRSNHGEGRAQAAPRQEAVDVMAQCYNCHTTATPLWRKDDEGKTVCNACGLYYKLHGSARPISMKSDVIRKRSRHDARRAGNGVSETPSASPGVSRRASPVGDTSPTFVPDSTSNQPRILEFTDDNELHAVQTELMHTFSQSTNHNLGFMGHQYTSIFPGPYHPDSMPQYTMDNVLPFATADMSDHESQSMSPRLNKRRRMSSDSASEPPSSAVSYSSFNDGYNSASSATSHRSSMDYPFSFSPANFGNPAGLRGSGNAFWHPPMLPQGDNSPRGFHPPMLPPAEDSMDYPHPPMLPQDEDALFSTYLHPPMTLPEGEGASNGNMNSHQQQQMFTSDYDASMRLY